MMTSSSRMRIIPQIMRRSLPIFTIILSTFTAAAVIGVSHGFTTIPIQQHQHQPLSPRRTWQLLHTRPLSSTPSSSTPSSSGLSVSNTPTNGKINTMMDDDDTDDDLNDDDKLLLRETPKSQLVDLCRQFQLETNGTKAELLKRLRDHATKAVMAEQKRRKELRRRVEEGGMSEDDDDREKYELVDDDDDDVDLNYNDDDNNGDDDIYVFVESKDPALEAYQREIQELSDDGPESRAGTTRGDSSSSSSSSSNYTTPSKPLNRATLTAPPPPDIEPNENGERVVTVYSTTDHNDLTGIAAAQPGYSFTADPMTGPVREQKDAPWNIGPPSDGGIGSDVAAGANTKTVTSSEMEAAKEELIELVQSLLALTGAPGFLNYFDDDDVGSDDNNNDDRTNDQLYESMGLIRKPKGIRGDRNAFVPREGFVGFDPTSVPADTLSKCSASLRMGRGHILQEVIREFELRAIGYDGTAGDNKDRGGGHYRQVSLVRTFLEGYRRAEEGRIARETATMLLDKLVREGIEGLDSMLSSMTRADDKAIQEAGELNDALLDYLNDAIRQQEKKVAQLVNSMKKVAELEKTVSGSAEDEIESLWSDDEKEGSAVQVFDPKDPKSKKALEAEYKKAVERQQKETKHAPLPKSAPEKILILLKLLRDRIKVEAAFSNDEKAQNLRILAYCLKLPNDQLRRELILKEFGSSLDRLDSFAELVSSSIEYGESTSYQLKPTKSGSMLNVPLLKRIRTITDEVNKSQSWNASGGRRSTP